MSKNIEMPEQRLKFWEFQNTGLQNYGLRNWNQKLGDPDPKQSKTIQTSQTPTTYYGFLSPNPQRQFWPWCPKLISLIRTSIEIIGICRHVAAGTPNGSA